MKHKLLCLFPILAVLFAGCIKNVPVTPPPPAPSGTFSGQFKVFHRHTTQVPFDSVKADLTIKFQTSDNTFIVTGDTSTVHAGSYGTFGMFLPYIGFNDKTFSPLHLTKAHLNGYYLYNYDGTNLIMYISNADTLLLGYSLKKISN
jgi:hypothetical protein